MPRAALVLPIAAIAGCVSAERDNAPPPSPPTVRPATVMLVADNFRDTDDNGYLDSSQVVAYVFGDDPRYPLPLAAGGTFQFTLSDCQGHHLAEWTIPPETVEERRRPLPAGPGFIFDLDLRAAGAEQLTQTEGVLACVYSPPDHPALLAGPTPPVRIGEVQSR